jgi:acylphosphatase
MTAASSARARIVVRGRVQGVAYRAFTQDVATRYGLCGGVRNLADGGVEVEVEGDKELIDALIGSLRIGPPRAQVNDLDVRWEPPKGQARGFRIWFD